MSWAGRNVRQQAVPSLATVCGHSRRILKCKINWVFFIFLFHESPSSNIRTFKSYEHLGSGYCIVWLGVFHCFSGVFTAGSVLQPSDVLGSPLWLQGSQSLQG